MTTPISAPGKLMLLGEHAVVYGYPSIVTAVNQRISVSTELTPSQNTHKIISTCKDTRFVDMCVGLARKHWGIKVGLEINVHEAFASTFGFGSSSAVVVACLAAIAKANNLNIPKHELFKVAYEVVLVVQKTGSGFDVAAAVYGGTLWYEKKGEIIEPLDFSPRDATFIVGYSGVKADTTTLINEVAKKRATNPEKINHIFSNISNLVHEAKKTIESKDWEKLGSLFSTNQEYLRDLEVSTPLLEKLISSATKAGAFGAKLSGAGGGDCIIALSPKSRAEEVKHAIASAGGQIIEVGIHALGANFYTSDNTQEQFVVVNENDEVLDYRTRIDCHKDKNLIHRAVEILLFDDKKRLLLQKRSLSKDTSPGLWTVSASGHVASGETYEQTAHRELQEELGLDVNLEFNGKFIGQFETESEFLGVFSGLVSDKITINQEEVAEIEFVSISQLQQEFASGKRKFSEGAIKTLQFMKLLI